MFHSSKEEFIHNFRQFLENWIFEGILTVTYLIKMVIICIISICGKKIFLTKLFVPLIKGSFCPQFYAMFGKLNFLRNIDRWGPYKNGKICIILICAKKFFFGKIIYSTHQSKCFSTMLGNFRKIEFLKEYWQAGTLQKWWKFVLSQFVLRKYSLAKLFVPLIKESVSPQF